MHSEDIRQLKTQFEIHYARRLDMTDLVKKNWEFLSATNLADFVDNEMWDQLWSEFDEEIAYAEDMEEEEDFWFHQSVKNLSYEQRERL